MADPVFFASPHALTVAEIAALTEGRIGEGADVSRRITGLAPLETAEFGDVTFFADRRLVRALAGTRAGACFCKPRDVALLPEAVVAIETGNPHEAFVKVAIRMYPMALRPSPLFETAGISPAAHVHPSARLEAEVVVEPAAVIGPGAEIGRGSLVGPGAVIGPGVRVGRRSVIGANVVVTNALIGDQVIIHPGAAIGQDGFGFIPGEAGHRKIPQVGRVIIQDNVEIGANTAIDRGSIRDTTIGEGTKIDNLCQIGHNTVIGRHCLIAGGSGISGTVTVGDFVFIGGGVGLKDNITIGTGARIGAGSGVHGNIPPGQLWVGFPARPIESWYRELKAIRRMGRQVGASGETLAEEEGAEPDER